ncbi:hypothetical protein AHAS_Ahas06G0026500 [Arachis hypogaea]
MPPERITIKNEDEEEESPSESESESESKGSREEERCFSEHEKEAKKEAFRKYLESSGAVDALTKVLVALYEQNDKPASALEFIQQKLSCPSISDYEKLQADFSDLHNKYNDLLAAHHKISKELEEMKSSHALATTSTKETTESESPKDGL